MRGGKSVDVKQTKYQLGRVLAMLMVLIGVSGYMGVRNAKASFESERVKQLESYLAFRERGKPKTSNIRRGIISWYSKEACRFNRDPECPTASGRSLFQLEHDGVLFGAMWDTPMHSHWKVTNIKNNKSVVIEILDRGPNKRLNRIADLCKKAFSQIADLKDGLVKVIAERIR